MKRKLGRALAYVVLVLLGIVGLAPFLYLALLSTKRRIEIVAQVPPRLSVDWAVVSRTYTRGALQPGHARFVWNLGPGGRLGHGAGPG